MTAYVTLNCGECGEPEAVTVPADQVSGVVACRTWGADVDVLHAVSHSPWCVECWEDRNECACLYVMSCDQCGAAVPGLVCRDCLVCPEPAGYWAWDWATAHDYLVTLERAAAGEDDQVVAAALMAHHAVMVEALGMQEEGE